ncbi:glycosyltransferase family 2 protein [Gemmatimonadota bacterium]
MSNAHEQICVMIMARDAAEDIGSCIASVIGAGEVIVADTGSLDATRELAAAAGATVMEFAWEGFGKTRNRIFKTATREWIFWLDSDERVTAELWESVSRAVNRSGTGSPAGYQVRRRACFLGKWMRGGGWGRDSVLRLFRSDSWSMEERKVHEGVSIRGGTDLLAGELLHYTDRTLDHYLVKFNRYTTLAAREMHESGRRMNTGDILIRPPWTFLRMYLLKGGFIDGLAGLVLAVLSGAYVFVKYMKLWELNRSCDTGE